MTPAEAIESYVIDVARQLPGSKRGEIALELRALLAEELAAKAEAAGRPADEAMATEMLRAFGRPAEVATRYVTPFTVIDPSDTSIFVIVCVLGFIPVTIFAALNEIFGEPQPGYIENAHLAWIGFMTIVFAIVSYVRRRAPGANGWKPRKPRDYDRVGPVGTAVTLILGIAALIFYVDPAGVLAFVSGGRFLTSGLVYTHDFAANRMPWLFLIAIPLLAFHAWAFLRGGWTPSLRWAEILFSISLAVQFGWHARYGNIVVDPELDGLVRALFGVIDAVILIEACFRIYHEWGRIPPAYRLVAGGAALRT